MNQRYKRGPQGVRSDRRSGSKITNRAAFRPFCSIADQLTRKHAKDISRSEKLYVYIEPTHEQFVFPVTEAEIRQALSLMPKAHLVDLRAVLVPSGTRKMLSCYDTCGVVGSYYQGIVYLYPTPNSVLRRVFSKAPNPERLRRFERVGGKIERVGSETIVTMTPEMLRQYYLRDVLVHEVGHHFDRIHRGSTEREREGYAEWFSTEFGFRLREDT